MTITKERRVRNTCDMTGDICIKSGGQLKLAKSTWLLFCNRSALAEADNQCPLIITRLSLCNEITALKVSSTLSFPPKYSKRSSPCSTPVQCSGRALTAFNPRKHEVLHGPVLAMLPRDTRYPEQVSPNQKKQPPILPAKEEPPKKLAQRSNHL